MKTYLIAASILESDILRLADEVDQILMAGVDVIHIESNCNDSLSKQSLGYRVCRALREHGVKCPIDIHLIGNTSSELIEACAAAGATSITICAETVVNIEQSLMRIKSTDCKAGLALRYPLVLSEYSHYLETVERLLFLLDDKALMPDILGDISNVINIRNGINDSLRVQAKGGISKSNVAALARAGVDTFILDRSAFYESDYYTSVSILRRHINKELASAN